MREQLMPIARTAVMVVVALLISGLVFSIAGFQAGDIFAGALQGSVTSPGAWMNTLRWTVPLALIGLGVVVSFRSGFFNVGAQGQLYLGAITAYLAAAYCPGPAWVVIPVAIAAGALGGALWALPAAALRIAVGTDETLSTLMLNLIGALVLQFAVNGPLRDPAGTSQVPATPTLDSSIRLSDYTGVSVAIGLVVIVAIMVTWVLVNRTRFGLSATLVGRNREMARWQGVRSSTVALTAFSFAGAMAGVAGAVEVLGPSGRIINGFSPTLGFTSVLVALVGMMTVNGAVLAAIFFGALAAAVGFLPIMTDLPASAFVLLQGIVAMAITAHPSLPRRLDPRLRRPAQAGAGPTAREAS